MGVFHAQVGVEEGVWEVTQTKFKLTLVAIGLLAAGGLGLLLAGIKDTAVWLAWIAAVAAMPAQYSTANAIITNKALDKGK